jgi:hypothetical protein
MHQHVERNAGKTEKMNFQEKKEVPRTAKPEGATALP